jgi:hypothetical protein
MMWERRYHFNRYGSYIGYVDEKGQYFLCDGTYRGRLGESGQLYDEHGTPRGHIDAQGQYWDEHRTFRGYFRGPSGQPSPGTARQTPLRSSKRGRKQTNLGH